VTQLPSSHRYPLPPVYGKRVRSRTYTVAVYLVIAVVLLQAGMLVSVFWLRAIVVPVNVQVPQSKPLAVQAPVAPPNLGPLAPTSMLPAPHLPPMPNLPSLSLTPKNGQLALLKIPDASDTREKVDTLNDEAQVLLHQNDLKNAAQVLNDAEDIDPRYPTTLKNLAQTYYLMNDSVRAKEYWQRLVDLGPDVGTIYASAKDHVTLLDSQPDGRPLTEPSLLPRSIYIDKVEKTPIATENGQPQFHLRTVLMRKDDKTAFDQKKLQPYVIFYQQLTDGQLVPDLGQRKGAFEDTFLFWQNRVREPFTVDYLMPTPGLPTPSGPPAGKYYGFVIGIYYDKILQDIRSEPTDLLIRKPLPVAIE
jgi:hypothetical protein